MTFSEVMINGFFGGTPERPQPLQTVVWFMIACAIVGYLLGSINWGVILSRKYGDDVRNHGSGNAGATNMMRTYGKKAGAKTLGLDFLKATVASFAARMLLGVMGAYIAGLFCIIGHAYPIFFKFKGGKGVVTIATMCLWTEWKTFLTLFVIYAIVIIGYKMVSMASCLVAALYPLILYMFGGHPVGVIVALLAGALVVYLHRANIRRIFDHTESKLDFHKKKKESVEENTDITESNEEK
jgi:glycerol-3-phosphate acyltransferase PlsY